MRTRFTFLLAAAAAIPFQTAVFSQYINPLFVHETPGSHYSQPDLDGDAIPDLVIVDRASGQVRPAVESGGLVWYAPVAGGIQDVSAVAAGFVEDANRASVALASAEANRVNLFSFTGSGLNAIPRSAFNAVWGLSEIVIIEEGNGAGGTEELLGFSSVFKPSLPGYRDYTGFNGTTLESYDPGFPNPDYPERDYNRFHAEPGLVLLGYFEVGTSPGVDTFNLVFTEGGSFDLVDAVPVPTGARVIQASFDESGVFQFVFYEPEGTGIFVYAWDGSGLAAVGTDSLPSVAGRLFPYVSTKAAGFLSVSPDGEDLAFYTFDGSLPVVPSVPPAPASALPVDALVPRPDGTLIAFSGSGPVSEAEAFVHDGEAFQTLGSLSIPSPVVLADGSNILLFSEQPFVNENAPLSGRLGTGVWTSAVSIGANVQATEESYAGPAGGLQNPVPVTLGATLPNTTDGLPNQVDADIALFDSRAAVGYLPGGVFPVPDPGEYNESLRIEFASTGFVTDIFYRILPDGEWIQDAGPTDWFNESVSISYFGMDSSERRTPVRTAAYTIPPSPDELDSDGDGVPDYVEIHYGLDPVNSGADSDDDGFSDLEEILAGTNPNLDSSTPPSKETDTDGDGFSDFEETIAGTLLNDPNSRPGAPGVLDFQNIFDLVGIPQSHDGTTAADPFVDCLPESVPEDPDATNVRLYDLSGSLIGFDRTANHGISGAADPNALIGEVPVDNPELPLVFATERSFMVDVPLPDPLIGRQIAGLVTQPQPVLPPVPYTFGSSGGALPAEAGAWANAAKEHYLSITREVVIRELDLYDTLVLLLAELKLEQILTTRGVLSGGDPLTLTGFRPGESALPLASAPGDGSRNIVVPESTLGALRDKAGPSDTGYIVGTIFQVIDICVDTDPDGGVQALRDVAEEIHRISAEQANGSVGSFLPPLDALRQFIRTGSLLNTGYLASPEVAPLDATSLASAYAAVPYILGKPMMRPTAFRELRVLPGEITPTCTVLEDTGNSDRIALLDSLGNPYPFPDAFDIPVDAVVLVEGYTDVTSGCLADAVLEVIPPVQLVSLPAIPTADANSNLIPDDLEDLYPQQMSPFSDSDGDGYDDLQEILEGTNPFSNTDFPTTGAVSLLPPVIGIDESSPTTFTFSFAFPGAYAEAIAFRLFSGPDPQTMTTDTGFDASHTGGDAFQLIINKPGGYPVFYRFRMTLK